MKPSKFERHYIYVSCGYFADKLTAFARHKPNMHKIPIVNERAFVA